MRLRIAYSIIATVTAAYFVWGHFNSHNIESATSSKKDQDETNHFDTVRSNSLKSELHFSNSKLIKTIIPDSNFENYTSEYGPLPSSLRGTRIPAYFVLDAENHLIVTPSLKSLIEYFLSGLGEESIEIAIGRIEEYFTLHLTEPARSEAIDILVQYIRYKESLLDIEQLISEYNSASPAGHDYVELFRLRNEARYKNLSPEINEAFFSEEEQLDLYASEVLALKMNSRPLETPPSGQMQELELLLAESEQLIRNQDRIRQQISQAKEQGASEEELYTIRANAYGPKAAERFAKADKEEKKWNTRYSEYHNQRASILSSEGLSEQDKLDEISILQNKLFNKFEKKRLATLDNMNAKKKAL